MSVTLKLTTHFEVTVGGVIYSGGSLTTPVSVTIGSELVHAQRHSVAQNTTVKMFDVDDDIANFDFLWLVSDQNVMLEMVTDDDGDVGEESYTVEMLANVPFVLASDTSYANYTVNFGGGTLDVIETIRVRNLGATTANVAIAAFT